MMDRMEELGAWIARNPLMIAAIAILMTIASVNFASQIEMHGLDTEDFVSTNSPLYEVYNHLYLENFGTQSIAILVEGSNVADENVFKAMLRLTDRIKTEPDVVDAVSIADILADANSQQNGVRQIPSQDEIDAFLEEINPDQLENVLPDSRHTLISVVEPGYLNDAQQRDVLTETQAAVQFADFPPGYNIIVTGALALTVAITSAMSSSQVELLALSGILMVVALLLVFRHVKWPLLPIPTVFLGIIWTFGAMGFLKLPMTLISFSAFPILIGIGIDYAIQFHNRLDEEFVKGTPSVQAMANTVNHVAAPVLIALTVTGAGFISLISSSVPMVRQFGIPCFMGLIMCYLSALFVGITVLYRVEKRGLDKKNHSKRRRAGQNEDKGSSIGLFLASIANFSIGGPEIEASVNGNDMFNRGDTVTLLISLANYGRIIGFKQDKTPTTPTEYALANAEQQEEGKITNAINIKATLLSNTTQIEVQSGDQVVQSLMAGQTATSPLRYTLQIANHAPAGLYPLTLRISYDYQSNVEVYAADLENIQGLPPVFVNGQWSYFYNHTSRT